MWSCIQLTALSGAFYIVLVSWFEFTDNPTFTSLANQQYPIWNIPFPAVSICSMNKISYNAIDEFADEL